jgi:hypothetical protein
LPVNLPTPLARNLIKDDADDERGVLLPAASLSGGSDQKGDSR